MIEFDNMSWTDGEGDRQFILNRNPKNQATALFGNVRHGKRLQKIRFGNLTQSQYQRIGQDDKMIRVPTDQNFPASINA